MGVEELGGEGAGEGFYGFALLWGQLGEAFGGAGQFGFADGFGILLEGEDGRDGVAGLETFVVFVHFLADDGLGGLRFAAAVGEVGGATCWRSSMS